jgi:hypothetical protein
MAFFSDGNFRTGSHCKFHPNTKGTQVESRVNLLRGRLLDSKSEHRAYAASFPDFVSLALARCLRCISRYRKKKETGKKIGMHKISSCQHCTDSSLSGSLPFVCRINWQYSSFCNSGVLQCFAVAKASSVSVQTTVRCGIGAHTCLLQAASRWVQ